VRGGGKREVLRGRSVVGGGGGGAGIGGLALVGAWWQTSVGVRHEGNVNGGGGFGLCSSFCFCFCSSSSSNLSIFLIFFLLRTPTLSSAVVFNECPHIEHDTSADQDRPSRSSDHLPLDGDTADRRATFRSSPSVISVFQHPFPSTSTRHSRSGPRPTLPVPSQHRPPCFTKRRTGNRGWSVRLRWPQRPSGGESTPRIIPGHSTRTAGWNGR